MTECCKKTKQKHACDKLGSRAIKCKTNKCCVNFNNKLQGYVCSKDSSVGSLSDMFLPAGFLQEGLYLERDNLDKGRLLRTDYLQQT